MSNKVLPPHYFDEEKAPPNDHFLIMSIQQGYVPKGCLLNGNIVFLTVKDGKDPCEGCQCDRSKCGGRIK